MGSGGDASAASMDIKTQNATLARFKAGRLNTLVSTSVAEEGLDLKTCQLVVRFDLPATLLGFVQSSGRARMPESHMVLMIQRGDEEQAELLRNLKGYEDAMRQEAARRRLGRLGVADDHGSQDAADDPDEGIDSDSWLLAGQPRDNLEYCVPTTGAKVTLASAKQLIFHFCARLPSDRYAVLQPRFSTSEGFISKVLLPNNSPVRSVTGRLQMRKQLARASACLEACRLLHQAGALTDNLLPEATEKEKQKSSSGADSKAAPAQQPKQAVLPHFEQRLRAPAVLRLCPPEQLAELLAAAKRQQQHAAQHMPATKQLHLYALQLSLPAAKDGKTPPPPSPSDAAEMSVCWGLALLRPLPLPPLQPFTSQLTSGADVEVRVVHLGSLELPLGDVGRLQMFHRSLLGTDAQGAEIAKDGGEIAAAAEAGAPQSEPAGTGPLADTAGPAKSAVDSTATALSESPATGPFAAAIVVTNPACSATAAVTAAQLPHPTATDSDAPFKRAQASAHKSASLALTADRVESACCQLAELPNPLTCAPPPRQPSPLLAGLLSASQPAAARNRSPSLADFLAVARSTPPMREPPRAINVTPAARTVPGAYQLTPHAPTAATAAESMSPAAAERYQSSPISPAHMPAQVTEAAARLAAQAAAAAIAVNSSAHEPASADDALARAALEAADGSDSSCQTAEVSAQSSHDTGICALAPDEAVRPQAEAATPGEAATPRAQAAALQMDRAQLGEQADAAADDLCPANTDNRAAGASPAASAPADGKPAQATKQLDGSTALGMANIVNQPPSTDFVPDAEWAAESAAAWYVFVPVSASSGVTAASDCGGTAAAAIDWPAIDAVARGYQELPAELITMGQPSLEALALLRNSVLVTKYNRWLYLADSLHGSLTVTSAMPDDRGSGAEQPPAKRRKSDAGEAIPPGARSFASYYRERWGAAELSPQRLLLARHARHRAAFYNGGSDGGTDGGDGAEAASDGSAATFLVPQLCALHPLSRATYLASRSLRRLMWWLEGLLTARELLQEVAPQDLPPDQRPEERAVLRALTSTACQEAFSYERMETLGDAVLKFATCVRLYDLHPTAHEGQLSNRKDALVSNVALAKIGLKLGLADYLTAPFQAKQKGGMPGAASSAGAAPSKPAVRMLRAKVLADVLEALTGAFFLAGGLPAATAWLSHIKMLPPLPPEQPQRSSALAPEEEEQQEQPRAAVEEMLGYRFRNRELLVEALTHCSWPNPAAPCYQRLEFLGDAVLDLLITRHIFTAFPGLPPGRLHDLRSASVNNERLAACAAVHRLHTPLRHMSQQLLAETTAFLDGLRSAGTGRRDAARGGGTAGAPHSHAGGPREEARRAAYAWATDATFGRSGCGAPKVLADIVESLTGAVFLDSGRDLAAVWRVLEPLLQPMVCPDTVPIHPVRELHERCQKLGLDTHYKTVQSLDESSDVAAAAAAAAAGLGSCKGAGKTPGDSAAGEQKDGAEQVPAPLPGPGDPAPGATPATDHFEEVLRKRRGALTVGGASDASQSLARNVLMVVLVGGRALGRCRGALHKQAARMLAAQDALEHWPAFLAQLNAEKAAAAMEAEIAAAEGEPPLKHKEPARKRASVAEAAADAAAEINAILLHDRDADCS